MSFLSIYYIPGQGTGPRDERVNEIYSEREDSPHTSGQDDYKYKKKIV